MASEGRIGFPCLKIKRYFRNKITELLINTFFKPIPYGHWQRDIAKITMAHAQVPTMHI